MERITYRKTLDVHKNGIQFLLQGFETADKLSRVIEISFMASGDAIDFPLENVSAWMYVTSPGADEPDIQACTIVDNKVVYEVVPIATEGITEMKIKLIETDADGMKSVLASPKFAVEVTESGMNDDGEELKAKFTDIESLIGLAKRAYDNRLDRIELSSDCTFYAYYSDGSVMYETDILKKLFLNGNVELSASYAHGGTGVRAGEDTDNSMYYSNLSKSEALNAKSIMADSKDVLEEVKLHGMYTAFSVDFTTGEVEYVSPSFKFKVDKETGELDVEGQTYTFNEEVYRVVDDWLANNGVVLKDLEVISKEHGDDIKNLKKITEKVPVERGGTGATTTDEALDNLGVKRYVQTYQKPWTVNNPLVPIAIPCEDIKLRAEDGALIENPISIYMINSGQIYLCYDYYWKNYYSSIPTDAVLDVYVNDEKIHSSVFDDTNHKEENKTHEKVLLSVEIGDIVRIHFKVQDRSTDYWAEAYCKNIKLYANIETPYTYVNFPLSSNDVITIDDVVNALVGE